MIKKPLAYISAAWSGTETENMEAARRYCRAVYEAGFSPICPRLYLPLFIDDAIPREHKDGIDMARDMLRRSHVLIICGGVVDGAVKNEIAVAQRLNITATTLDGILTVKGQGEQERYTYRRKLECYFPFRKHKSISFRSYRYKYKPNNSMRAAFFTQKRLLFSML